MDSSTTSAPHHPTDNEPPSSSKVASSRKAADYTIAQCKAVASRTFGIALGAAGLSQRAAANACGVSRNLVTWWADPDHSRTIPLGRLLIMAETSRRGRDVALSVLTAALSHIQHVTHITDRPLDLHALIDDLHAEVGEVAAVWRAAKADGIIDADERRTLAARLADVERVIAWLRHELAKGLEPQ